MIAAEIVEMFDALSTPDPSLLLLAASRALDELRARKREEKRQWRSVLKGTQLTEFRNHRRLYMQRYRQAKRAAASTSN